MPELSPVPSDPAAAEKVPAVPGSVWSSMLALQVGVVVVAALYVAREVLIPITLAILLSFVLAPLVDLLRRLHLGRIPSALLAVIFAIAVIIAIGGVIGTQLAQLATNIPQYTSTIERKVETVRGYTIDRLSGLVSHFEPGAKPEGAGSPTVPATPAGEKPAGGQSQQAAPAQNNFSPLALAERFVFPILSPIATIGIVFVVAIFVLLQKEDLRDRMIRLFGSTDLHRTTAAMDDAGHRLTRYFLTQLAVNVCFGVIIGVGLYFIGVPHPALWGILSGIFRFIPYFGSFISAGLPIALAASVEPGWSLAIWTAVFYVAAELTVSQAVEPVVYGHSTGLSPFAVIISAIFWSWLWGAIGLILSMPLTLCLVVLGRYVQRLEFLDVLLGDRPALSPVESFYQRILAGDADELQDQAEALLQTQSLSSYYDEVALKGIQLAAYDANRGVLRPNQLEQVKNTIMSLVEELSAHEDKPPEQRKEKPTAVAGVEKDEPEEPPDVNPPASVPDASMLAPQWRAEAPILCLAGNGSLDEAASAMLAQLLEKHGLGARVAPYQAASREGIKTLDVTGVRMVCLSYLDISGSPSHLRYLIRRLRQKVPGLPILVGLWPADDPVLTDALVGASIGADYYTTSLREAVNVCLTAALTPERQADEHAA